MSGKRRTARWIGLAVAWAVGLWWLYESFSRATEVGVGSERWVLPALSLALVVLFLGLAGVLIRNLVRLIVERKRGILGSRLRTKLVFFFLALVLLPAIVLFYGSAQVIKTTVEAIARTPLEELSERSGQVVAQWNDHFEDLALTRAREIAEEIETRRMLAPSQSSALHRELQRRVGRGELQVVWVVDQGRRLAESGPSAGETPAEQELHALLDALVAQASAEGRELKRIDYLGRGLLAHAAVPLGGSSPGLTDASAVVAVGIVLPTRLAENLEGIDAAVRAYRQFRTHRRELVRLYLTLIGLVFLVTIFVATWIGFYVSRRITGPIQELAAASREISAGNLDVRVGAEVGDELGTLIEAFNEMAAELQESREVITRSTADLRRSNRALDERRRYIETLLANLSTAVISLDPEGRVSTANPAVREILGVELEPAQDMRAKLTERPGLDPLSELLDHERAASGEGLRRDLSLIVGSHAVEVAAQVSPLRGMDGEDLGTLVMVEDLTEQLRAQKAVAWREIARRIAHEIKNPLTPIQLSAQRLRKRFEEDSENLADVLPEATAAIEREVSALKGLVDEFSRFARMPEVAPQSVKLRDVVESAVALFRDLPQLHCAVELDSEIDRVKLDPEQIRRVLINLIDNAVAAMQGRGNVQIRARRVAPDGTLRIDVADSGPGVSPEDRNKMFMPYYSTKSRGTGLGLAIVHRIVTDHRGTVRVESNRPRGARFIIELPA